MAKPDRRVHRFLMAEQWEDFARRVLPPQVSAVQRQEMRRAFYAGGEAIMFKIIQAFAPEGEPTAQDLAIMSNLHQELQDFAQAVKAGRA